MVPPPWKTAAVLAAVVAVVVVGAAVAEASPAPARRILLDADMDRTTSSRCSTSSSRTGRVRAQGSFNSPPRTPFFTDRARQTLSLTTVVSLFKNVAEGGSRMM
jgi:hypothetical protein